MLDIKTTTRFYCEEDKEVTTYTPFLSGNNQPCFSGELSFACFEVYTEDKREVHEQAKKKAIDNARLIIKEIYLTY